MAPLEDLYERAIWSDLLVAAAAGTWLWQLLRSGRRPRIRAFHVGLALYLPAGVLSMAFADDLGTAVVNVLFDGRAVRAGVAHVRVCFGSTPAECDRRGDLLRCPLQRRARRGRHGPLLRRPRYLARWRVRKSDSLGGLRSGRRRIRVPATAFSEAHSGYPGGTGCCRGPDLLQGHDRVRRGDRDSGRLRATTVARSARRRCRHRHHCGRRTCCTHGGAA